MYIDIRAGSNIYGPVEAMSDNRTAVQRVAAAVQRVSMMKRAAVVDYSIDYGLRNMHGTRGRFVLRFQSRFLSMA